MASPKIKSDALAFYNRVIALQTKLEVAQTCNELLESFVNRPKPLAPGTISGYLTDYKEYFKGVPHENPELNEPVKDTEIQQHCAYSMLNLSTEQMSELTAHRAKSSQKKMGFEEDGELKDTTNIPKINIQEIIKESVECLKSENPATIACGILNLTGLRISEQGMPRHEHKEAGIIEHTMVVLDDYLIGFRGVVKKRGADDSLAFYARPTLEKAQKIVDAQTKYLQSLKVQAIVPNIEKFEATFYQNIKNEYKRRFGKSLSTLDSFDSEGNLKKQDGTPHRGRSFYACALRAVLKLNGFGNAACIKVIQKSLAHDNESETMKYLGSFDESLFINPPTYIEVSTNLNDFGKMINTPVIPVKETVKSFNLENFQDGLEAEESMQLVKFLRSGMSETQAILELFKMVRNKKPATKTAEKNDTAEVKEKPRSVIVSEIVEGIMHYNRQATEGNIKLIAIPSHGLIGEIAKLIIGVTIAPTTVNNHFKQHNYALDKELKDMGIVEGMKDKVHNSVCFRGEFSKLAATILEYIESD